MEKQIAQMEVTNVNVLQQTEVIHFSAVWEVESALSEIAFVTEFLTAEVTQPRKIQLQVMGKYFLKLLPH